MRSDESAHASTPAVTHGEMTRRGGGKQCGRLVLKKLLERFERGKTANWMEHGKCKKDERREKKKERDQI